MFNKRFLRFFYSCHVFYVGKFFYCMVLLTVGTHGPTDRKNAIIRSFFDVAYTAGSSCCGREQTGNCLIRAAISALGAWLSCSLLAIHVVL